MSSAQRTERAVMLVASTGLEKYPKMRERHFHWQTNFPLQVLEPPLLSTSTKPWALSSPFQLKDVSMCFILLLLCHLAVKGHWVATEVISSVWTNLQQVKEPCVFYAFYIICCKESPNSEFKMCLLNFLDMKSFRLFSHYQI